ncbi:hypothetical protein ANASTE_00963 [Anaerofustis stercorihominis DSM 17244]|uniref:Uncharacterized protein n=1 Tax=Anaerofustis stercorihominis DSM 17244 TaxID=445971 RepID=B1C8A6_9FIRM|nr:hypothetical protein ANASTE_00963 [Anaerofustis stercorihominis DSM 17244]
MFRKNEQDIKDKIPYRFISLKQNIYPYTKMLIPLIKNDSTPL